ncbi:MAG: hypothetical protein EP332_02515 [Bacteroidetes bacterium]|nr:MAG: hypothetical protein EP332_02515 [Bacteroidota bacterium]
MSEYRNSDSLEAWKLRAEKELKGKPLASLNWTNDAGIDLHPYYTTENSRGEYPVLSKARQEQWSIFEPIVVTNAGEANAAALLALESGATGLMFKIPASFNMSELPKLLNQVGLPFIESGFLIHPDHYLDFALALAEFIRKSGWDAREVFGFVQADFGKVKSAELHTVLNSILEAIPAISAALSGFRLLVMDAAWFREQGLNDVQEMGVALAWFHFWLDELEQRGIPYAKVNRLWQLNLSSGGDYFLQVAKFRSIGYLLAQVAEKFGEYAPMYLMGESTRFNMAQADRHTNLLRLTSAAMSAVQGTANGVVLYPFSKQEDPAQMVQRITRNIQLLLHHESNLGAVTDPAKGSYYVEELSFSLAEKAWDYFLAIEEQGGYLAWIQNGGFDTTAETEAGNMLQRIANRKQFMLGVNQFPGKWPAQLQESERFLWESPLSELVNWKRQTESGEPVKVHLLVFGDGAMRSARAGFAQNFMGCADITVTQELWTPGTPHQTADILVLCADDASYETAVAQVNKGTASLVLAGHPGEKEAEYKSNGVDYFIHIKSPLVDTLRTILEGQR